MNPPQKDAPLAALFCTFAGVPTIILGVLFLLPNRHPEGDDFPCLWGVVYLVGAGLTGLLALVSLLRREDWRLWTVLCAVAALLPAVVGLALSR